MSEEQEVVDTPKPPQEKSYTLKYTETELLQEFQALEGDRDIQLYLEVQKGATKYKRYIELAGILEKKK